MGERFSRSGSKDDSVDHCSRQVVDSGSFRRPKLNVKTVARDDEFRRRKISATECNRRENFEYSDFQIVNQKALNISTPFVRQVTDYFIVYKKAHDVCLDISGSY